MRPSVFILPQLLAAALATAQSDTAGVGVYPGDPGQDFAPTLVPAEPTYRNLAFRRPAYHSSSYDFNLTAQLLTDGVSETTLPRWIVASSSQGGVAPQHEREFLLDRFETSAVALEGAGAWLQLELAGGEAPLAIDGVELQVRPRRDPRSVAARALGLGPPWEAEWAFHLSGSDDGRSWHELGRAAGTPPPPPPTPTRAELSDYWTWSRGANPTLRPKVTLAEAARHRFYRITLEATGGEVWSVTEVAFFEGGRRVEVGGPHRFHSSWMSAGVGQEWVAVDLGAECAFDRVVLSWIRGPAEGVVQVSPDGRAWRDISPLAGRAASDDLRLPGPVHGRWVRVLMERPSSPEGYVLSELEVFGRGGLVPRAKPAPPPRADGRLDLAGGAWRIQRDSLVTADGVALSRPGFADADWVVATVPATVLSSYWNAGALPDPNLGDNQLMISDAFFYADFWYRTEFQGPAAAEGRRAFLNFDGVNWKAEVYLNGERLGRVEGAFTRGRFDVTGRLRPGGANALAVRVEKNRTPGSAKLKTLESAGLNGGGLGADNPTYHASIGWDWIPTVRGRNIGLWNDVYVTSSGPVTIDDPFVRTTLPLPDTSPADVRLEVPLTNHDGRPVAGTLVGRFGAVAFEQPVRLDPGSSATVVLDPSTHPGLRLRDPKLWWPNGYGDPHLYEVRLRFLADGAVSDEKAFRAGVRQLTYGEEGGALRIWINGRRFVARGGNWGFPESNLRYRGREYDAAVRYHRDMNFTMIRNWVGQTGDDELYEACDRHGIVVWQDFWLANPYDGPDPEDEGLFLANVRDTVRRIRTHPSVGLYCGRNEGQPPPALESGIRAILGELHGEVHYIPNSASGPVSGHGPYWAERPDFYFRQRATPKLHSEMGMPNVVNAESLRQMIPSAPWPPSLVWGLHDFNLKSAQRLDSFRDIVERTYGGAQDADDWVQLAQFVNYDGYRAMFEAQGRNRMGLLLWMSHPAWPSFAWQTYDYFFDPTAAYFGVKKASEPLHIQWNPVTDEVEVVNYSAGHARGLSARAEVLRLDGSVAWEKEATLDSAEDSVVSPMAMEYPSGLTPVHFVRLRLRQGEELVSENIYLRGLEEGDHRALRTLPAVTVEAATRTEERDGRYLLTTALRNPGATPALLVRLVAVRGRSGDRILPVLHGDNYVTLMPGERRTIRTEVAKADARGEAPAIRVEGFNVTPLDPR